MAWVEVLLGLVCSVCLPSLAAAYSDGAPSSTCGNLTPSHGGSTQTTASPYAISVSATTYSPGGSPLTVILKATCGTPFKGFLLTARHAESNKSQTVNLGTFNQPSETKAVCTNVMTHTSSTDKTSVAFQWTPPSTDEGPIVFRATFVQTKLLYWVDVHSDVIQRPVPVATNLVSSPRATVAPDMCSTTTPAVTSTTTPAVTLPPSSFQKDAACGSTKGCFSDCSGNSCGFLMSWEPHSTNTSVVVITLKAFIGTGDRYVAFGLSSDLSMGDDSVTECTHVGGNINVYNSKNNGKSNNRLTGQTGLTLTTQNYANGVLTCTFTRTKTGPNSEVFNLNSTKYNIFLSRGPASTGQIDKHDIIPPASAQAVSLVDFTVDIDAGDLTYPLIKAHGSIMMVAWIFAASIGIVMARYFKSVWSDSTWFGQKIWFQVHRACMVIVLIATVIAFIIIFVEVGGYSEISGETAKKAHPVLGIITTGLCVINPIMALFRPHPGTKNRPIFNWAHWAVGTGAHILGVVTVFLGVLLEKAGAPEYMIYVLAAFVIWQVLIQLLLELTQCVGRNSGHQEMYEMNGSGTASKPPAAAPSIFLMQLLLGIHLLVVTGFIVALLVILNIGDED